MFTTQSGNAFQHTRRPPGQPQLDTQVLDAASSGEWSRSLKDVSTMHCGGRQGATALHRGCSPHYHHSRNADAADRHSRSIRPSEDPMVTSTCVDVSFLPLFSDPSYPHPGRTKSYQLPLRTPSTVSENSPVPIFSLVSQQSCREAGVLRPPSTFPVFFQEPSVAGRCHLRHGDVSGHSSSLVYSRPSTLVLSVDVRRCRQDWLHCFRPNSRHHFHHPSEHSF